MFSKVITFIVVLMIASSAYSYKSHLDRFIHVMPLQSLSYLNLGDHAHTYLHNPRNTICFTNNVFLANDCDPPYYTGPEFCYACCDKKCPGDDNCKYDLSGFQESCDTL